MLDVAPPTPKGRKFGQLRTYVFSHSYMKWQLYENRYVAIYIFLNETNNSLPIKLYREFSLSHIGIYSVTGKFGSGS